MFRRRAGDVYVYIVPGITYNIYSSKYEEISTKRASVTPGVHFLYLVFCQWHTEGGISVLPQEWNGFGAFGISVVRECVQQNPVW